MIDRIYIRALFGIAGITAVMIYAIHTMQADTNVILAGIGGICAIVYIDRDLSGDVM